MDKEELVRYLDASIAHSIVVDVRELDSVPGILRMVTIHRDLSVSIEYMPSSVYLEGSPEGGVLKYMGTFESVDEAVNTLEVFLETPLDGWKNYTAEPYSPSIEPPVENATAILEELVRRKSIKLPAKGDFDYSSVYWRLIGKFGEYRPDKVLEEQGAWYREHGFDVD